MLMRLDMREVIAIVLKWLQQVAPCWRLELHAFCGVGIVQGSEDGPAISGGKVHPQALPAIFGKS